MLLVEGLKTYLKIILWWVWWLMPIFTTQEAEIGRILVQDVHDVLYQPMKIWVWWSKPVILVMWKENIGGSWSRPYSGIKVRPYLKNN
jgi:hypothetical protein